MSKAAWPTLSTNHTSALLCSQALKGRPYRHTSALLCSKAYRRFTALAQGGKTGCRKHDVTLTLLRRPCPLPIPPILRRGGHG